MSSMFVCQATAAIIRSIFIKRAVPVRSISRGTTFFNEEEEQEIKDGDVDDRIIPPNKDRRMKIPVETSIKYLASDAYKETYGDKPVWKLYRRNHKGMYPPKKTRKTCIRDGIITTGNPCPICRDEYLVLDHLNTALIKQFISEFNGAVLSYTKTGVCQREHRNLLIAIHRAKDRGTIAFDVPFREYNYSDWYKPEIESNETEPVKEKINN